MSIQTSSTSSRSTEILSKGQSSALNQASGLKSILISDIKQPVMRPNKHPQKNVHFGELEGTGSTLAFSSSDLTIKTRSTTLNDVDVKQTLAPEVQSLFTSIASGNLAFFDLVPGKAAGRKTHNIDLELVHPKTLHTPLTMALQNKQIKIAVSLLVLGADPLALDGHEKSPADYATPLCRMFIRFFNLRRQPVVRVENSEPRKRFLQLLHAQDADTGETMLSWAITQRLDKMAALLIFDGADYSGRNAKGAAPLEVATRYGSVQIVNAMLEVWPQLATRPKLPYLKQAIMGAVEMDRPALLASLLVFFSAEFRANEASEGLASSEDHVSIDQNEVIPRNARTEDEAFEFFMKAKLAPALTIQQLMLKTKDSYLLTEHECWLLGLDKAQQRATEMGHQRILELLAARTSPRS